MKAGDIDFILCTRKDSYKLHIRHSVDLEGRKSVRRRTAISQVRQTFIKNISADKRPLTRGKEDEGHDLSG